MPKNNLRIRIPSVIRDFLTVVMCCLFFASLIPTASAQDLTHAVIVISQTASARERQAAQMLSEEVGKRTLIPWVVSQGSTLPKAPQILLARRDQADRLLKTVGKGPVNLPAGRPEGFSIRVLDQGLTVLVAGTDERGVLFGAGYLLRHLDLTEGKIRTHGLTNTDSAPAYPVRGHQLGYRPKNNTFDGWSAQQFEQYIRDLAVFGTNTIELIPPRSDDDATSPLFTDPPMQMMVKLSTMLDKYGLDCSIWYPALDKDYSNPATIEAAVQEWGAVFDQLPRIDAVFVPGGDPGHTEPKFLFALMEKEAARLRIKHPNAQMWVSPQGFSAQWLDEFYGLLALHPAWLTGVVYGPEMRDSPEAFRKKVPANFPIRFYPDITHTLSAQYPVPLWDAAFALTEGREPINPRPVDESILFHRYSSFTNGFVAYSEGSNDDINKILWSAWGWDPATTAAAALEEYGRYFIAPTAATQVANAAFALETNWRGPLLANTSIKPTFALLKTLERQNAPQLKNNWRLQQMLYRGYYDAFVAERLTRETHEFQTAVSLLKQRPLTDSVLAEAEKALPSPAQCSEDPNCKRAEQLADDLFRSIRMQLSVPKYKAIAVGRGANLDQITNPLTSAVFLKAKIAEARGASSPANRMAIVDSALMATGDVSSDIYDDLGDSSRQKHLVPTKNFEQDPSGLQRTYTGIDISQKTERLPLPLRTFVGALYDSPVEMQYQSLPSDALRAQIDLLVDARKLTVRANGTVITPLCDDSAACFHPSYELAASLVHDGSLRLSISTVAGLGSNGRSLQITAVRITSDRVNAKFFPSDDEVRTLLQ